MKLRNKILALTMLLAASHSSALTLGRVRGAAVVGQSLDLSVQVQLGSDETANSLCLEADVFHADSRQDPNRVKIVVEPTQQASTVNARITSPASVDEPMVTIYVRAGCGQKISRRYVLLADFPSESATPVAPTVVPFVAIGSTAGAVSSGASVSAPEAPSAAGSGSGAGAGDINKSDPWSLAAAPVARPTPAPKPAPRVRQTERPVGKPPRAAKPVLAEKPKVLPPVPVAAAAPAPAALVAPAPVVPTPVAAAPAAATAPVAAPAASAPPKPAAPAVPVKTVVAAKPAVPAEAGQSRLKLDPMVMLSERVASLESSTTAPAAEVSRDAQRVQSLEDSVKTLVALATKNEASLQDMRVRLQRAEADRFPVQWLYGLGFLILACLGAIAYLWSRLKARVVAPTAKDDWWSSPKPSDAVAPAAPSVPAALRESFAAKEVDLPLQDAVVPPPTQSAPRAKVPLPGTGVESRFSGPSDLNDDAISELDVSLVEMSESNFDQLMQSDKSHSALRRGPLSGQRPEQASTTKMQSLAPRTINSDQLFDVRQQADFFVSLGQTDQAIQILEKQINDHGETSPLIYLDLLQIFHSLNLKTDYRQFREDFNLLFNGRVPEFSMFTDEGRGLQDYPHVLAHITALWSTRKALMVIEASIFRDPLDERSSPFDLGAFRDLLLLHAIAQSFTVRDDVTSDLAPLRANMGASLGTHSKGARLSASGSSGSGALTGLEPSGPSALAQLDISLSTGGGLHEAGSRAAALGKGVSAGTVVNAVAGAAVPNPAAAAVPPMAATHSELDLDLDLSDFAQLVPETKKSSGETSEFSKLLRAQAPSKATSPDSLDGAQKPAAPSARAQAGSAGGAGASGAAGGSPAANASPAGADDNLLNFDLPPSTTKLNVVKPKR